MIKPKNKLFRSLFDFKDVMQNMRPGIKKGVILRKWKQLYGEVVSLDNGDWWVEGERTDSETNFLRDERDNEIRLSAEQGREYGRTIKNDEEELNG